MMKPFVFSMRDKVVVGALTMVGLAAIVTAEFVNELIYLPVYLLMAVALAWQWIRKKRATARSDAARSTGSR